MARAAGMADADRSPMAGGVASRYPTQATNHAQPQMNHAQPQVSHAQPQRPSRQALAGLETAVARLPTRERDTTAAVAVAAIRPEPDRPWSAYSGLAATTLLIVSFIVRRRTAR